MLRGVTESPAPPESAAPQSCSVTLTVSDLVLDMDDTINRTGPAMRTGLWRATE